MNNKIAVILPVYKNDKPQYLSLAIESILYQTYRNIHLYIGVDGPVGDELHKNLELMESQTHVRVVWFPENRGLACVLNDLLDICFNEGYVYIARMDADDLSLPDRLEKQIKFLISNPDVDVVGGAVKRIDGDGCPIGDIKIFPLDHQACVKRFEKRNPLSHPAVMFRKSFFDKIKGAYRNEYRTNQDTVLWFDGLMHGIRMANLPDVILKFRVTNEMLGNRRGGWKRAKKQLDTRLMINKGLGYGGKSYIYAYLVFIYMVSPLFIKRVAYKYFK